MVRKVDVLVIGAGPTGCAAALAFEKKGADVLLVEGQPKAAERFAGEWMHPPGVRKLSHLGVDVAQLSHARGLGFALCAPGEEPVELPYARGASLARYHHELVEELRAVVQRRPRIEYQTGTSFKGLDGERVILRRGTEEVVVDAGRVIAADGRGSKVRVALGAPGSSEPVSYMMGVELKGARLPAEGLGHVFSGGPGPALFYRVNETTVRGCLDVPNDFGPAMRKKEAIREAFEPVLPPQLREPFRRALECSTPWAATRFQPRTFFGRGRIWLAGDALGHVHPITGMGMTLGILDGAAAADCVSLKEYESERSCYVVELLTNALYHVLQRDDESARHVRSGMFALLRSDASERLRTMRILTGEDEKRSSFVSTFAKVSGHSLWGRLSSLEKNPLFLTQALVQDLKWLKWPLSCALAPLAGLPELRETSTFEQPWTGSSRLIGQRLSRSRTQAPST